MINLLWRGRYRVQALLITGFVVSALLLFLLWSPRSTYRLQADHNAVEMPNGSIILPPSTTPSISSSYTAVILYLVRASRISELLQSLASINSNLPGPKWPIIFFHTGDFDEEHARADLIAQVHDYIGARNGSWQLTTRFEFVKLDWKLPEGISQNKTVVDPVESYRWPGYHHMCAFFSAPIFFHPRLKDVTYYMRMDTDSLIQEPLCYDPFSIMHARKRAYGYRSIGYDVPEVTVGMMDYIMDYANRHPAVAEQLRQNKWDGPYKSTNGEMVIPRVKGYLNSFEIVKLDEFRRADVKEWLDELMSVPERAYKWRWGDAPLRHATVQMFFDDGKDTEEFCGMKYFHPFVPTPDCPCMPL